MPRPGKERVSKKRVSFIFLLFLTGILVLFGNLHATTISSNCVSCHNNTPSSGIAKIDTTAFSYVNASHYYLNAELNVSAFWHMDNGDGNTANDSSGNANHAKIWGDTVLLMHFEEGDGSAPDDETSYENDGSLYGDTLLLMHFDEGSGTTANDETSYNNSGTINGSTYTSDGPSGSGYSLGFDGVDDYVNISSMSNFNPDYGTISLWIYIDTANTNSGHIYWLNHGDSNNWMQIVWRGDLSPQVIRTNRKANGVAGGNLEVNISSSGWYHYVRTWSTSQGEDMYLNGVYITSNTSSISSMGGTFNFQHIGARAESTVDLTTYFNGSIDEVAIYNRSLTPSEISDMYSAQVAQFVEYTNDTPSGSGYSLSFDGSGDYIGLGNDASLNITGTIWFNAFIKPGNISASNIQNIIAHGHTFTPNGEVFLRLARGKYQVGSWDGSLHNTEYNIPVADENKWVHLSGGYNGTDWVLYRNGTLVNSTPDATGAVYVNESWAIGARGTGTERFFNGSIDEVAIYNRSLTPSEISDMYSAQVAKFVEWGTGRFNSGLRLDGSNEFANASSSSSLNITGEITMEAWVNLSGTGKDQTILRKEGAYALEINSSNNLNASLWLDTGFLSVQSSSALNAGQWYHVAATFDGTTLSVYLDGQGNGSAAQSGTITKTSNALYMGSTSGSSRFFNGTMDEVQILGRAKSAAEIGDDAGGGPGTDLDRRCWACHYDGTSPPASFDHDAYPRIKDPWNCTDCHLAGNYSATTVESHRVNDTRVNTTVSCSVCHNNSVAPNYDSGAGENNTAKSNVSHYGTNESLSPGGYNTTNCTTCHRNPAVGALWGGATRIRHSDDDYISCSRCHNTSTNSGQPLDGPFRKLHDANLTDARHTQYVSVHYNYDWEGDDADEGEPGVNPEKRRFEACPACHNESGITGIGGVYPPRICEDCHTPSGSGPYQGPVGSGSDVWELRGDYATPGTNARAPQVYDHYFNSSGVNVSNQSGRFGGNRLSSCYDYNNQTGLGSCHGVSFHINTSTDGKYAHSKDRPAGAKGNNNDTYHYQLVVDYMPDTTNCTFCHKQTNSTKRDYWGGAPYVGDNMGTQNSQCLACHLNRTLTLYNFHEAVESDGTRTWGLMSCGSCHFNYPRMSGFGKPQFWMNEAMFRSSVHGNTSRILCTDCHTNATDHQSDPLNALPPENAWKWCECCHVGNGTAADMGRHNLTFRPQDNMYNSTISVMGVTNCTWCHDPTIYYNAVATYNRTSGKDCRFCHPFPDKLPGGD
jgi:hypothetical protein